jgi:hypothetical protein
VGALTLKRLLNHPRQIIEVLQQVMYTHNAEQLAISVLEIYEGGYPEEGSSK